MVKARKLKGLLVFIIFWRCGNINAKEAKGLIEKFKKWYKITNKKDFSKKYRIRFWLFKNTKGLIKI